MKIVHYRIETDDGYNVGRYAPCGAQLVSSDPNAIAPGAIAIHQVTCPACKAAVRAIVREFNRARRAGVIDKTWGAR